MSLLEKIFGTKKETVQFNEEDTVPIQQKQKAKKVRRNIDEVKHAYDLYQKGIKVKDISAQTGIPTGSINRAYFEGKIKNVKFGRNKRFGDKTAK